MKFLPSTTNPDLFGWEDFFLLLAVIGIPGLCFLAWIVLFRKQKSRRRRRRRRRSRRSASARKTAEWSAVPDPDDAPGETKS